MLIQFAAKNLFTKKRASLVSIAGISISIALLIATILILKNAQESFAKPLENAGADMVVQLQGEPCVWSIVKLPTNLNPISLHIVDKIASLDKVHSAGGSLITWAFSSPPPIQIQEKKSQSETQELQNVLVGLDKGELDGSPCDYAPPGSFCEYGGGGTSAPGVPTDFRPIVVVGVDPELKNIGPIKKTDLDSIEGRFFTKEDNYVTILDRDFARTRDLKLNDIINLGQRHFIIVGILDSGRDAKIAGAQAFIPLKTAIETTGRGDIVDIIFIKLKGNADPEAVRKKIKTILPENATITSSSDYLSTIAGFSNFTHGFSLSIFAIVILIALLLTIKTSFASVLERTSEIGVLKGIGWRNKDITKLILIENLIVGLTAGTIGSVVGVVASLVYKANLSSVLPYYLNPYPPCSQYLVKSSIQTPMTFPWTIFLYAILGAIAIEAFSGALALRRVLKLSPAEAMRKF